MLLPVQNLLASVNSCYDLSICSGASDLDEELYVSDNKQGHGEFDKETTADMQNNHMKFHSNSPSASTKLIYSPITNRNYKEKLRINLNQAMKRKV